MNNRPGPMAYQQLGETNVAAHKRLLAAARRGDVERVRKLMVEHIDEAESHVRKLDGRGAPALRARFGTAGAHRAASEAFRKEKA